MNKQELIKNISMKSGLTKVDSEKALVAFEETVMETVASSDKVMLVGFGSFECKLRAARQGRNPKENTIINIPERRVPVFKAGKIFKEAVNG